MTTELEEYVCKLLRGSRKGLRVLLKEECPDYPELEEKFDIVENGLATHGMDLRVAQAFIARLPKPMPKEEGQ